MNSSTASGMPTPGTGKPKNPSKAMAVLRVTSGNFLEQFDFFLFGFYASDIAKVFFPSSNDFASLMMTFAVFGAGFLMRPLGAIVLGAYIDREGRKKGLILTLSLMAVGTIILAFMPGYATIGVLAPILVLVGRLLQGFSAGAELGGVSVYLAEIAPPGQKGFYAAWQSASQQVAIVLAALLGFVVSELFTSQQIDTWAWRVPFFVGCAIIPLIFIMREHMEETEAFEEHAKKTRPTMQQIVKSMFANWKVVLCGGMVIAMTTTTFYLITVYTPTFANKVLHLSKTDSLIVTAIVGVSNFFWLPVGGALSDRIGRKGIMVAITALTIVTAYPALHWLAAAPDFTRLLLVLLLFSFYFGMYNGAAIVALAEVIPMSVRVVGFSMAYSLATAVFGGFTHAVSTYLIKVTGDVAAPGYWLSIAAACGLVATLLLYRNRDAKADIRH